MHLPDLVAADAKVAPPAASDLRMRRGLEPMPRFRLDSVGSSTSSVSSTPATPLSAAPSSSASTVAFFSDFEYATMTPATPWTPSTPSTPSTAFHYDAAGAGSDVADGDDCAGEWRRVGRDLRSIADAFAATRPLGPPTPTPNAAAAPPGWLSTLASLSAPLASPIVSALAAYFWWKMVKRLA